MISMKILFFLLVGNASQFSRTRAQPSEPLWHLQRIVQRNLLSEAQLVSGKAIFDMKSVPTQPVTIYIVDSGVQIAHEEFFNGRATYGANIVEPDKPASDCNGHGTHVAALAGGAYTGVATQANIVSVRVLDCKGRGSCADIISALNWVGEHHANMTAEAKRNRAVVVMSIGSSSKACAASQHASSILWKMGIVITAAAGNQNTDSCLIYPARNTHIIGVGAIDNKDRLYRKNNYGACVDLFAPGVRVISAMGTSEKPKGYWKRRSGTSMATPIVAGVAATMLGADPTLSSNDVKNILISSSTPNKILTSDGQQVMTTSANRLLYAPWARLFDSVVMNVPKPLAIAKQGQISESSIRDNSSDWNSSTVFGSLSLILRPKTKPAMQYAMTRIQRTISKGVGIDANLILGRRAAGVQRLANGSEPESLNLVFYIPMEQSLVTEYYRRLLDVDKNGVLKKNSSESIELEGGSMRSALILNVTVPEGLKEPIGEEDPTRVPSEEVIVIVVSTLLSVIVLAMVVGVIATHVWSKRKHREDEAAAANESVVREDTEVNGGDE